MLEFMHEVHGLLSKAGSGKDRSGVAPKGFEPGLDIEGMIGPWLWGESKACREKSGTEFSHEFFGGVALIAKPAFQVSVQP